MKRVRVFYLRYYGGWCVARPGQGLLYAGTLELAMATARSIVEEYRARLRRSL